MLGIAKAYALSAEQAGMRMTFSVLCNSARDQICGFFDELAAAEARVSHSERLEEGEPPRS
jgi:hypothetical protein